MLIKTREQRFLRSSQLVQCLEVVSVSTVKKINQNDYRSPILPFNGMQAASFHITVLMS